MNNHSEKTRSSLLPYPIIAAAVNGDIDAINRVLRHYEGYIAALSMRQLYDEYGYTHWCIDENLRRRLETKLITRMLNFRLTA